MEGEESKTKDNDKMALSVALEGLTVAHFNKNRHP
jgi:hypothetical protein